MRGLADEARIRQFMRELGRAAKRPARVYLTGGDFIPVKDGWEGRSRFVVQEGPLAFYNFDFTAQALAKIERGHAQDLHDVQEMLRRGLVTITDLQETFRAIEPFLYRYPAVDTASFRAGVERILREE